MRRVHWMISLCFAFVLCFAVPTAHAAEDAPRPESDEALDRDATAAYRRGDLVLAHDLWLSCLDARSTAARDAGDERARILYNLGNVAFRQKNVLEAVGWYTASLDLRPRDGDTWVNLEHARSEAKLEPADRGDLTATIRRLLSALTLAESEWLVLGALGMWAVLLALEAVRGGRVCARLAFVGFALVVVCAAPWAYNLSVAGADRVLIVGGPEQGTVEVRSEPRADAALIGDAALGKFFTRLDALPEWTKIELENGVTGWVPARAVFSLAPRSPHAH